MNMALKGNLTLINLMNEKSLKSQLAVVNVTIFFLFKAAGFRIFGYINHSSVTWGRPK